MNRLGSAAWSEVGGLQLIEGSSRVGSPTTLSKMLQSDDGAGVTGRRRHTSRQDSSG
jgi:hypothetical protein